ncbi:MAG: hypothetical protein L0241_03525 [Planctomycetia bacterium]|nr:hypothetical protein [Planctomycetia bacterium]
MIPNSMNCRLGCEQLEARENPDGNVAVAVSGGVIFVAGDAFNNRVVINQDVFGNVFATGLNNTTVNGVTQIFLGRGIPNRLIMDMGAGNDRTEVLDMTVFGHIEILGGLGDDSTFLLRNRAGGVVAVNGTSGNDETWISGVNAALVVAEGDVGFDRVHIDNAFTTHGVFIFNHEQFI